MENQINVDRAKVSIVERLATICAWVNILLYVVIVLSLEQTQGSKTEKKAIRIRIEFVSFVFLNMVYFHKS